MLPGWRKLSSDASFQEKSLQFGFDFYSTTSRAPTFMTVGRV